MRVVSLDTRGASLEKRNATGNLVLSSTTITGLKNIVHYLKLDHCIMQFQGFDWLSRHGT